MVFLWSIVSVSFLFKYHTPTTPPPRTKSRQRTRLSPHESLSEHLTQKANSYQFDHEGAVMDAEAALPLFEQMKALAREASLPVEDIEFMQDSFGLIALARRYYFLPWSQETVDAIIDAKKNYKLKWPRGERQRYRIKTDFERFRVKRQMLSLVTRLLIRKTSRYRLIDHLVVLSLLSFVYRLVGKRSQKSLPKFVRKSAMGIDSVMR